MSLQLTALIIFIITYTGIIFTRLPKMNIDRPSAAFFGAVAMILFGVIDLQDAVKAIDYNTIILLLGMMIIIATLQLDGFFSWIAAMAISWSKTRFRLLVIIVGITGISSAFLVNDAVVLLFTPVIISICRSARINPLPFLIAEILASNAGSVMTMTGNPQNMLIGLSSGITYSDFLFRLLPVSVVSMVVIIMVIRLMYRKTFSDRSFIEFTGPAYSYDFASMKISSGIFLLVILFFFLSPFVNISIPLVALAGASLILILGKVKPSKVIRQVDWVLLLFFASLFIVVEAAEKAGILKILVNNPILNPDFKGLAVVHGISLFMSQIVSNVPYTIMMIPSFNSANNDILWLALASASTLAGNATIIGAMANLIVIEVAERDGVRISFYEFFKSGLIVSLVTLMISVVILWCYL